MGESTTTVYDRRYANSREKYFKILWQFGMGRVGKVWHRCIFTKFSQRFYLYESLHGIANEYENKG